MPKRHDDDEIEIAVGPHSARPDWSVMRVTYRKVPEHQRRITAAIEILLRPLPPQEQEPSPDSS